MNLFQNQLQICVRDFALGLRPSRVMNFPTLLFCVSLFLASTIPQANGQTDMQKNGNGAKKGIMCYVCNSARDPRCGDPFDSSTIEKVDCDQFMPNKNATVCRKNVQKAVLGSRTDYRVIRTCGYLPENPKYATETDEDSEDGDANRCYNKAGTFEVQVTYCSCFTDGCNPAPRQAWASLSMLSQTTLQLATMITGSYLMLNKGFY